MKERLLIIGNGMAPGRLLENLFKEDAERYSVSIFNAEPRVNYNRLMLSPVLSGEMRYEDIVTHDDAWYQKHAVKLHKNTRIVRIDRKAKAITTATGDICSYDKLVIATGSNPIRLPLCDENLEGVLVYRDLDDVEAMLLAAEQYNKAVVIGGGLLGLEAAAGLQARGLQVTVVHLAEHLMERQLDAAAAHLLKAEFERRGINVLTETKTEAILGKQRVTGVRFSNGTELETDLLIMAVGIKPSTELASAAELIVERGIVVDDQLRTSDPNIFALGECVQHRQICYGLVAPLYDMANVLAQTLLDETAVYVGSHTSTKLKVNGVDLFSAGTFEAENEATEIVLRDACAGIYKRLVIKNDLIEGIVLYGDTDDGAWFFDLMKRKVNIGQMRDSLIFGSAYQGGADLDPTAAVAALPDKAEICGCNGVCKGTIVNTIKSLNINTLDAVRAHTKASSSCGTCTSLVRHLMAETLGDAYHPETAIPICPCTDLDHDEVRHRIRAQSLKSIPALMQALEWKSSCGCAKCRPALNYYLVCEWPEEYSDDYQSRFINERVHANIQKNGSYSIVPRMWGGMTSSTELRAIADVVDKFDIPAVKVTGGQRIDLLGVSKPDLPLVWADLGKAGFVSGHAYAKGLRTVKTCVGKQWCRFGTQDSTSLGIRLERYLWGSWTPAKVKLAVSGCPRNCAEATCKDIGVICVDSGFDLVFAGAAGLDIKGTESLGHVETDDEVVEYLSALLQMYREQGHYLERIYKWAKRVGIGEIRRQIIDDAKARADYHERFRHSQSIAQVDPWTERVKGCDGHEFTPLSARPLRVVA